VLAKQIQMVYGNLSVETMMRYVNPIVQTGDLHIAVRRSLRLRARRRL
jgi:hypothetical protein